jgi:hypothetical protein
MDEGKKEGEEPLKKALPWLPVPGNPQYVENALKGGKLSIPGAFPEYCTHMIMTNPLDKDQCSRW